MLAKGQFNGPAGLLIELIEPKEHKTYNKAVPSSPPQEIKEMNNTKTELFQNLLSLFHSCEGNTIPEDIALEGCAGLVLYEEPLFGISSADDSLYKEYKKNDVVGSEFMLPSEWLPGAKSVISFFLPFTESVRVANRDDPENTAPEWLHARIEGQVFLDDYTRKIQAYFEDRGINACVPCIDPRFSIHSISLPDGHPKGIHIYSNWSERHAAYAAGLGTFCLTRGLISAKGVAGRYGSVIVTEEIEPDQRPYTGIYDYCIRCGACIKKCPANAISLENGKNQLLCQAWVGQTGKRYAPRYGCGKCQVGVPCESRIP